MGDEYLGFVLVQSSSSIASHLDFGRRKSFHATSVQRRLDNFASLPHQGRTDFNSPFGPDTSIWALRAGPPRHKDDLTAAAGRAVLRPRAGPPWE